MTGNQARFDPFRIESRARLQKIADRCDTARSGLISRGALNRIQKELGINSFCIGLCLLASNRSSATSTCLLALARQSGNTMTARHLQPARDLLICIKVDSDISMPLAALKFCTQAPLQSVATTRNRRWRVHSPNANQNFSSCI